jgi:hypothetical protein
MLKLKQLRSHASLNLVKNHAFKQNHKSIMPSLAIIFSIKMGFDAAL